MSENPEPLDPDEAKNYFDEDSETSTDYMNSDDYYPILFIVVTISFVSLTVFLRYTTGSWAMTYMIEFLIAIFVSPLIFPSQTFKLVQSFKGSLDEKLEHTGENLAEEIIDGEGSDKVSSKTDPPQDTAEAVEEEEGLIDCPDCGNSISTKANNCPHCGRPFESRYISSSSTEYADDKDDIQKSDNEILRRNPAMFRGDPARFCLYLILSPFIIGIILLIHWYIETKKTTIVVMDKKTHLRKGILSKRTTDILHRDVKKVQVEKGPLQRVFNVGDIYVQTAGKSGNDLQIQGIENPEQIRNIINNGRRSSAENA